MSIIDIHAHDGAWEHAKPGKYDYLGETMEAFNRDLDRDGIERCFISSVAAVLGDLAGGNAITFADAGTDRRLSAYVYYDPTRPAESLGEIEKYREHPKFIGFKSRPEFHDVAFSDPSYRPLVEAAARLNRPILLHTWPLTDAHAVVQVARETKARIIMVHACAADYAAAVELVRPCENVFVEPTTSTRQSGEARAILNVVGRERVLFGTDYGLISRQRVFRYYEEARLSSAEQEAIFHTNAKRLFGLSDGRSS